MEIDSTKTMLIDREIIENAQPLLEEVGIDIKDKDGETKDLLTIINELSERWDEIK